MKPCLEGEMLREGRRIQLVARLMLFRYFTTPANTTVDLLQPARKPRIEASMIASPLGLDGRAADETEIRYGTGRKR